MSITSLTGLKGAMEASFQQSLAAGMVTVKSTLAYNREILYHEAEEADAERDFRALISEERSIPEGSRLTAGEANLLRAVLRIAWLGWVHSLSKDRFDTIQSPEAEIGVATT